MIPIPQQDSQTVFPNVPLDAPRGDAGPILVGGSRVAQGVDSIGQGLDYGANVLAKHAIAFQGMQNEATARDADTKGLIQIGDLQNSYLTLEGKNRVDAYPKYQQDLRNLRQSLLASMPNPMAAKMLDAVFTPRMGYAIISGSRAAADANKQYLAETSVGRIAATTDDAIRNYNDPALWARSLGIIKSEVENQGGMMGWPQEKVDQMTLAATSNAWKMRVERAAEDSPQSALRMLAANAGQMDGETLVGLRQVIHSAEAQSAAMAEHAEAMAERNLRRSQAQNTANGVADAISGNAPDVATLAGWLRSGRITEAGYSAIESAIVGKKVPDKPEAIFDLSSKLAQGTLTSDDVASAYHGQSISDSSAVTYMKALSDPTMQVARDPIEKQSFATLKSIVAPGVDQGFLNLDPGGPRQDAAVRWAAAQTEWTERVMVHREDPRVVLGDMEQRYGVQPKTMEAFAVPRMASAPIKTMDDLKKVAIATVKAHDDKVLSDDEYSGEAILLGRIKQFLEAEAQRRAALGTLGKPGGATPLGVVPNSGTTP